MKDVLKGLGKFLLILAVLFGAVIGFLRLAYVDVATVGHGGMAPTLVTGDVVAVWRGTVLDRGQIALCEHPTLAGRFVIGRVVGLAGDRLTARGDQLYVGDRDVSVDWGAQLRFMDVSKNRAGQYRVGRADFGSDDHRIFLEAGHHFTMRPAVVRDGYFLLGDNRSFTGEDSRTFGPVPAARCKGRVFMRVQPAPARNDDVHGGYGDLLL